MEHYSIKMNSPIELINITPLNPLIAKCEIKVCWVGDEANPNKSIITKEAAKKIANSLPGSPIVGFYDQEKKDFTRHAKVLTIEDGVLKIKDITRPYGFVDLSARVWFQKFLDDGQVEREYLMTEGYLWKQYEETAQVLETGRPQSMVLDSETLDAFWTKDEKNIPQFFIINEAIISQLCILGDDVKPCFNGANIAPATINFTLEEGFKQNLSNMMQSIQNFLNKGGKEDMTEVENANTTTQTATTEPAKDSTTIEPAVEKEDKDLKNKYDNLVAQYESAKESIKALEEFKRNIEHKQKEELIAQFTKLTQEDKSDVVKNIDTYTLDEIEAKLSVACFRKKLNLSEDVKSTDPTTYSLNDLGEKAIDKPAWLKEAEKVAKEMN